MEDFFQTYGPAIVYFIIFVGSFVEGESIVLTSSALSYRYDEISLPVLMFLAFLGSVSADQLCFFIGRKYGPGLFDRRPHWKPKIERVFYHLRRHSTWFIFSFRFIYGIRTISPIVIGAAGVSIKRFAIINFFAAIFWAVSSCSVGYILGYFFADDVEEAFQSLGRYQKYIFAGLFTLLGVYIIYKIMKAKREH